jgi:hypothetical protein
LRHCRLHRQVAASAQDLPNFPQDCDDLLRSRGSARIPQLCAKTFRRKAYATAAALKSWRI